MQVVRDTVLVVDDEPTIIAQLSEILSPFYKVRAANKGEKAIEIALSSNPPSIILLDLKMPGLDGYGVLKELKRQEQSALIPVLFVTSDQDLNSEEKGLSLGAADYINKPVRPPILLARIKAHLTLSKSQLFLRDKNQFLESEISRIMHQNKLIQDVSIRALAHIAETRDPETGNHILRTQNYVKILAETLRAREKFTDTINDSYIELLTKSAPLHDIGKVGIPDSVLLKPDRLNNDEWKVMKTHSELGSQAIEDAEKDVEEPVEFLKLAKEIARWHHERWDGSGYPDGLQGLDIPLSARIMALADVFDALISQRVYKKSMPVEIARDIILYKSQGHFDPDVVEAFRMSFEEFVRVAAIYSN